MKKGLFVMAALMIIPGLCSCGTEQSFYRTEEGHYSYNGHLYKNDGEMFLSEAELEYVELLQEFPEGVEGAEWYTELYRYSDWLLLGIDDSRSLSGLESYRYFLLIPESDRGREEYELPDGTPAAICYNGAIYELERDTVSDEVTDNMETVGMIQSIGDGWPEADLQTNVSGMLGHLLFECDGKLLISRDGETYGVYAFKE